MPEGCESGGGCDQALRLGEKLGVHWLNNVQKTLPVKVEWFEGFKALDGCWKG